MFNSTLCDTVSHAEGWEKSCICNNLTKVTLQNCEESVIDCTGAWVFGGELSGSNASSESSS